MTTGEQLMSSINRTLLLIAALMMFAYATIVFYGDVKGRVIEKEQVTLVPYKDPFIVNFIDGTHIYVYKNVADIRYSKKRGGGREIQLLRESSWDELRADTSGREKQAKLVERYTNEEH